MNWYMYWFLFVMLFLIIIPAVRARRRRQQRIAKQNRLKRRKGENIMNELIKSYIGKEVIVWAGSSSGIVGTAVKIEENWLEVEDKSGNKQLINTDYISRIQEYPRNKNGKKKAFVG